MHIYFHIARGYFILTAELRECDEYYMAQNLSCLLGSTLPKRLPVAEEMAQLRISRGPRSNY